MIKKEFGLAVTLSMCDDTIIDTDSDIIYHQSNLMHPREVTI